MSWKTLEKSGLEPTAPNRLADQKHCALLTQPNPFQGFFFQGFSRHLASRHLNLSRYSSQKLKKLERTLCGVLYSTWSSQELEALSFDPFCYIYFFVCSLFGKSYCFFFFFCWTVGNPVGKTCSFCLCTSRSPCAFFYQCPLSRHFVEKSRHGDHLKRSLQSSGFLLCRPDEGNGQRKRITSSSQFHRWWDRRLSLDWLCFQYIFFFIFDFIPDPLVNYARLPFDHIHSTSGHHGRYLSIRPN